MSEEFGKWISVKDRLPGPFATVLVFVVDGAVLMGRRGAEQAWMIDGAKGFFREVTHWQPLPDPPPKPDAFEEWCGNVDWGQRNIAWIEDENGKDGCAITRTVARKVFEAGAASEREKTR